MHPTSCTRRELIRQSLPKPDRKALAETFGIRWGTYGEIKPEKLPPSGLLGPVRLVPRRQWVARL
jgi:hypothetical protein